MEQARVRYRIVGGIVLAALAAILWPLLNDVRQPLPQGSQAIDIPNEPTDGVARHIPADGSQLDGQVPEPETMPEPVPPPPLTEDAGPEQSPPVAQPEAAPPAPVVARPPVERPEPVKPAPKPAAPAVVAKPSPATPPPAAAKSAPPVAKAVPATPTPVTPAPEVTAAPPRAPAASPKPPSAPAVQQAWVVQLGVFGNVKTAIDLRESLRKAGHSAFTEEVATPHGKALRVRVGPELDRAKAQAVRDRLARQTGHDGIVVAYP